MNVPFHQLCFQVGSSVLVEGGSENGSDRPAENHSRTYSSGEYPYGILEQIGNVTVM